MDVSYNGGGGEEKGYPPLLVVNACLSFFLLGDAPLAFARLGGLPKKKREKASRKNLKGGEATHLDSRPRRVHRHRIHALYRNTLVFATRRSTQAAVRTRSVRWCWRRARLEGFIALLTCTMGSPLNVF